MLFSCIIGLVITILNVNWEGRTSFEVKSIFDKRIHFVIFRQLGWRLAMPKDASTLVQIRYTLNQILKIDSNIIISICIDSYATIL